MFVIKLFFAFRVQARVARTWWPQERIFTRQRVKNKESEMKISVGRFFFSGDEADGSLEVEGFNLEITPEEVEKWGCDPSEVGDFLRDLAGFIVEHSPRHEAEIQSLSDADLMKGENAEQMTVPPEA
jgi:hypothetical protein